MLAAVVFEPSATLLVPEVAGPAATDTVAVRAAAVSALASATTGCDKWIALGATDCGGSGQMPTPSEVGTFARFGVDVSVTLTAGRTDPHAVDPEMSLSMLVAAWLRGQSGIDRCRPVLVGADTSARSAIAASVSTVQPRHINISGRSVTIYPAFLFFFLLSSIHLIC